MGQSLWPGGGGRGGEWAGHLCGGLCSLQSRENINHCPDRVGPPQVSPSVPVPQKIIEHKEPHSRRQALSPTSPSQAPTCSAGSPSHCNSVPAPALPRTLGCGSPLKPSPVRTPLIRRACLLSAGAPRRWGLATLGWGAQRLSGQGQIALLSGLQRAQLLENALLPPSQQTAWPGL